jgi:hypothetical protein
MFEYRLHSEEKMEGGEFPEDDGDTRQKREDRDKESAEGRVFRLNRREKLAIRVAQVQLTFLRFPGRPARS